jgi:hypothetical protein
MKPRRGFPDNKTQLKYQHLHLKIQALKLMVAANAHAAALLSPSF